jgi:hypothetical protein
VSNAYTSSGKRRSAMTHASRSHTCELCGHVGYGNGAETAHGRAHVRRGEAVELLKHYETYPTTSMRVFLAPDDPLVAQYRDRGFAVVTR